MAGKKKTTNYISFELKKLESYYSQLQNYLDNNPPDLADDRVKVLKAPRGGETIKVISTKEDQIKLFLFSLEKLPNILLDLNRLRKEVDGEKKEVEVRGDQEMPGFMDEEDDEEEIEREEEKKSKSKKKKVEFDDDSFYDESEDDKMKLLPPPNDEDDQL